MAKISIGCRGEVEVAGNVMKQWEVTHTRMHTPTHSAQSSPEAGGKQMYNGFFLDWADVHLCASVWKKQTCVSSHEQPSGQRQPGLTDWLVRHHCVCCTSSSCAAFKLQQRLNIEMTAQLNCHRDKRSGGEAAGRYRALPLFMCSELWWRHCEPHEKGGW